MQCVSNAFINMMQADCTCVCTRNHLPKNSLNVKLARHATNARQWELGDCYTTLFENKRIINTYQTYILKEIFQIIQTRFKVHPNTLYFFQCNWKRDINKIKHKTRSPFQGNQLWSNSEASRKKRKEKRLQLFTREEHVWAFQNTALELSSTRTMFDFTSE